MSSHEVKRKSVSELLTAEIKVWESTESANTITAKIAVQIATIVADDEVARQVFSMVDVGRLKDRILELADKLRSIRMDKPDTADAFCEAYADIIIAELRCFKLATDFNAAVAAQRRDLLREMETRIRQAKGSG